MTFYPGGSEARDYAAPAVVGLRPGYIYRVKLTGLPGHPKEALYPTLEVRGTLVMPPGLRAADFPVPIVFTAEDIDKVLASAYVTKIFVLEHPDQALPDATQKDRPIEIETASSLEAVTEARVRGRPMLILRWGDRAIREGELPAESGIPGTILLPDQQTLAPAARPPCFAWSPMQVIDPILGPKPPEEECLHDGGDTPPRAGLNALGQLGGLNPTDTVAVYADSHGKKHIAVSNRVCICVPRYVVLAATNYPAGLGLLVQVGETNLSTGQAEIRNREKLDVALQNEQLRVFAGKQRLSANEIYLGTRDYDQFQGGAIVFGFLEGQAVLGTIKPPVEKPDLPLQLRKCADKISAQVGDIVTFQLIYSNVGGKPITGVVVSDSLTGRLEYIEGSAKSDRHTTFTIEPNEAGSVILRWAVTGALPPGQIGTVIFQARIR
jgi:uncharacterized repeat protein (TIGR01451 family)